MADKNTPVAELANIGATISKRLQAVGIHTRGDLETVGPAEAWRKLMRSMPGQTVPLCYYLYALEGALRDCHWNDLPDDVKADLRAAIQPARR
jgi:DNA transformation protein